MSPRRRPSARAVRWSAAAALLIGALLAGIVAARAPDLARHARRVEGEVGRALAQAGVRDARLVHETRTLARTRGRSYHLVARRYRVPARFSTEAFVGGLVPRLAGQGYELLRSERRLTDVEPATILTLGYRGYPLYTLTLQASRGAPPPAAPVPVGRGGAAKAPAGGRSAGGGKVAIVLDDWGYNQALVPMVLALNRPVTLAILPHQRYSRAIAAAVQDSQCEVILHLPMEPRGASPREPQVLAPGMPAAAVRRMLDEALATVPTARGLSNHQGSKATEDPALMRLLLGELQRRQLMFLDSLVTDKSVCRAVALDLHLPFAQRAVFLDNEATPQAVRQQLLELAAVARRAGVAVGIGHDKRVTLEVLQEVMPQLEQTGIEFVRLGEVAQRA